MASHPRLRETLARAFDDGMAVGAGAARLLRGNHDIIAKAEKHLARWLGAPACLLTSSGYQANYLLLSTLPQRGDVVLYDANVHACIRDGIRASNAQSFKFAHNDLGDLQRLILSVIPENAAGIYPGSRNNLDFLSSWDPGSGIVPDQWSGTAGRAKALGRDDKAVFIVTESLFSMDGDFAPIAELHQLAIENNAMLIVDEAHATGIYGPSGKGCCEGYSRDHLITVHTGGKALGSAGGFIAARQDIIDLLINTARPFIFATAPMPVLALALQTAIEILDAEPQRRKTLLELCDYAQKLFGTPQSSPIVPIILGADKKALTAAEKLQTQGFDVRAIRPPTVPEGTARLRISINISTNKEELEKLAEAVKAAVFP
jgi:8-amino-7-oxononanoate synthase